MEMGLSSLRQMCWSSMLVLLVLLQQLDFTYAGGTSSSVRGTGFIVAASFFCILCLLVVVCMTHTIWWCLVEYMGCCSCHPRENAKRLCNNIRNCARHGNSDPEKQIGSLGKDFSAQPTVILSVSGLPGMGNTYNLNLQEPDVIPSGENRPATDTNEHDEVWSVVKLQSGDVSRESFTC